MKFGLLDTVVFVLYILGTIAFALWMGSRKKGGQSAEGYFKADKQLPWYVVGASMISAGVSSEQFIGTVGIAYLYGMAVANYQWAAPVVYTILIFVFLPFYMRGNVTTMPEFLERRYNSTCRRIYALVSIVSMAFVILGVTMYAGSKAMTVLFPVHVTETGGILMLALAAGIYSIYGGLLSSVWADFIQYIVLMFGGITVGLYSLYYSGGIINLLDMMPEKAIMLYDAEHPVIPWFGLLASLFSVGIWYSCANQLIVQRFLGSRSEWDARMGVIMAGLSMAVFPLIVVLPGIAAFYLFHDQLSDGDKSWAYLVQSMLPSGIVGIVLAGLASSILGTLAAVINSAATIFTYDIYKPLIRSNATDKELFRTGRVSATAFMGIGILTALYLAGRGGSIFVIIQTAFSYMAAPVAAVFLVGILWKRATPVAATIALIVGFGSIWPIVMVLFPKTALAPYDSFPHHTFTIFVFSILAVIVLSLLTSPKSAAELEGVIWDRSALGVPENERHLNRGLRDFRLWWLVMVLVITTLYVLTYSRANKTRWLEAEKTIFAAINGEARIQTNTEINNFNLWTNTSQVLFTPATAGAAVAFELPIEKTGPYRIVTVVTKGPGYGVFAATVNGTTATLQRHQTSTGLNGKGFEVEKINSVRFDANTSGTTAHFDAREGRFVVDRLELGTFPLSPQNNNLTFQLVKPSATPGKSHIGIDQIILTPAWED